MSRFASNLGVILLISGALYGHHSVGGDYDTKNVITVVGTITVCSFGNPHVMVRLDSKGKQWEIFLPSPNMLLRAGVKKEFCKVGADITVRGWSHRERPEMYALRVVLGGVTYRDDRDTTTP